MLYSDFIGWGCKQIAETSYFISNPRLLIGVSDYLVHKNREKCFCYPSHATEFPQIRVPPRAWNSQAEETGLFHCHGTGFGMVALELRRSISQL